MMLAFAWWSVFLFVKNKDAFEAKRELQQIRMVAEKEIKTQKEYYESEEYKVLAKQYGRQEWMIVGEATFFVLILVIGIWMINRGYNREVMAAKQRRNFLLSITHELKSPIASIRLVLETFLRHNQLRPEQMTKLNQSALQETDRLNNLVNNLLLSAKLETLYEPYLEPIDLSALLMELIQKMEHDHPQAHFTFQESGEIMFIQGDSVGLTSVFLNLLENAVKYAQNSDAKIHTSIQCENACMVIRIADNGIGIEEKEKKMIFEKFYRVGSEDTRKTKGTGLGLFIVDQIVKAHKGTIKVSDNQPRGTVFTIKLPINGTKGNKPKLNTHDENFAG
ncbi:MAG: two-component sensor histidine kinase [Saprospiraceae bacterium]|nr:MAG: two-component sensor histidine kinase [Saprospiraceae bacterium]